MPGRGNHPGVPRLSAASARRSCGPPQSCLTTSRRFIHQIDEHPEKMCQRRATVEHPFGTIKARMGTTHFLMKTLPRVECLAHLRHHLAARRQDGDAQKDFRGGKMAQSNQSHAPDRRRRFYLAVRWSVGLSPQASPSDMRKHSTTCEMPARAIWRQSDRRRAVLRSVDGRFARQTSASLLHALRSWKYRWSAVERSRLRRRVGLADRR
jgi:hypothetical protein